MYSSLKAAVDVLTRTAAKELGSKGIRVNSVLPGDIPTTTMPAAILSLKAKEKMKQTPLGRLGTPEEVAHVVAYLAGPQSSWVNGQNIEITGGA